MHISEINIYPVKSLKGITLDEAIVEKRGLQFDRRWMLTDPEGMFFTQRQVPKMATVEVAVNGSGLKVSAKGFESMPIPYEPDKGHRQNVVVWHSEVAGLVYNGEVSEWFSDVLGTKCQLVRMPESSERHVDPRFDQGNEIVSFADGYPLLLIGEASLDELNQRISENADKEVRVPNVRVPLPMNRFRPNVVVSGSGPFEEDKWARIGIGEVTFRVPKPCGRCVMTTVEQTSGTFDGKEPLRTMATFRMAKQVHPEKYEAYGQTANAVLFGENLIPENPGGVLRVGDAVRVLESRS